MPFLTAVMCAQGSMMMWIKMATLSLTAVTTVLMIRTARRRILMATAQVTPVAVSAVSAMLTRAETMDRLSAIYLC